MATDEPRTERFLSVVEDALRRCAERHETEPDTALWHARCVIEAGLYAVHAHTNAGKDARPPFDPEKKQSFVDVMVKALPEWRSRQKIAEAIHNACHQGAHVQPAGRVDLGDAIQILRNNMRVFLEWVYKDTGKPFPIAVERSLEQLRGQPPSRSGPEPVVVPLDLAERDNELEGLRRSARSLRFALVGSCLFVVLAAFAAVWAWRGRSAAQSSVRPATASGVVGAVADPDASVATAQGADAADVLEVSTVMAVAAPAPSSPAPASMPRCPDGFAPFSEMSFPLRAPADRPSWGPLSQVARTASTPAFCLQRGVVSMVDFEKCTTDGPCKAPPKRPGCAPPPGAGRPASCVAWEDAAAYCQWRWPGGGLPTVVQWEGAARTSKALRSLGIQPAVPDASFEWVADAFPSEVFAVGPKPSSTSGVRMMFQGEVRPHTEDAPHLSWNQAPNGRPATVVHFRCALGLAKELDTP